MIFQPAYRRYTVAEFFCGCGGFSHGFARTGRFDIVLGNDIKKAALRTFQFNHVGHRGSPEIIEDDIRSVSLDRLQAVLASKDVGPGELDCLIGGPPCQGFSQMRRSEEREGSEIVKFRGYNRLDKDPRNDLVLRFLEVANALQPKIIVIENVPQMLRHGHNGVLGGLAESVIAVLEDMDYKVAVDTLNAANYGVPQLRERAFFIASRVGSPAFPLPTHADITDIGVVTSHLRPWVTVADAIADLPIPPLTSHDELGGGPTNLYRAMIQSDYAKMLQNQSAFPYNHITRRYREQIIRIIQEMEPGETWDHASDRMQRRYESFISEVMSADDDPETVKARLIEQGIINPVFYRSYYWSAYTRLAWDRPALTITANANFLGSGRYTHPEADRGITMREAARLQSYDDGFRFLTSPAGELDTTTIGVGMDMIGEAVPPLLAQALATQVAWLLDNPETIRQQGQEQSKQLALPFIQP